MYLNESHIVRMPRVFLFFFCSCARGRPSRTCVSQNRPHVAGLMFSFRIFSAHHQSKKVIKKAKSNERKNGTEDAKGEEKERKK